MFNLALGAAEGRHRPAPRTPTHHAALRAAGVLLLASALLSGCCCGLGQGKPPLEDAERPVGVVQGSGLAVSAELRGEYVLEHHGAGRMSWTSEGSEESWTLDLRTSGSDPPCVSLVASRSGEGWRVWAGSERETGAAQMAGLSLQSCAIAGGAVFEVSGLSDQRWFVVRRGDGWGYVASLDSDDSSCAEASADVVEVSSELTAIWEDGVRAAAEHAAAPGPGRITEARIGRESAAERACGVLLDRGDATEALRCFWASRVWANPSMHAGRRAMALIQAGPSAELDLEAAMFALLASELPPATDPRLDAQIGEHTRTVAPDYIALAPTEERVRAYVERAASQGVPSWQLSAVGSLAHQLQDEALCDRLLEGFTRDLADPEAPDRDILEGAKELHGCGSEPAFRGLMLVGLGRETLLQEAAGSCQSGAINERTYRTTICHSFPPYAGSFLGAHCGDDANERAWAIARERLEAGTDPYSDARLDGALRVLWSCDRDAIRAELSTPGHERTLRFVEATH